MDKNEVILKSYRFLSPSIMTTGRKGRKIGIAVKAKAEGKEKKKKKTNLVLQYKNVWGGDEKCQDIPTDFENAKFRVLRIAVIIGVGSTRYLNPSRRCLRISFPFLVHLFQTLLKYSEPQFAVLAFPRLTCIQSPTPGCIAD